MQLRIEKLISLQTMFKFLVNAGHFTSEQANKISNTLNEMTKSKDITHEKADNKNTIMHDELKNLFNAIIERKKSGDKSYDNSNDSSFKNDEYIYIRNHNHHNIFSLDDDQEDVSYIEIMLNDEYFDKRLETIFEINFSLYELFNDMHNKWNMPRIITYNRNILSN